MTHHLVPMKRIADVAVAAFVCSWALAQVVAPAKGAPRFENYPATALLGRAPTPPRFGRPEEQRYQTVTGSGVKKGVAVSGFSSLAEALTSSTRAQGIEVRHRMFSVPDFPRVCTNADRVARLDAPIASVVLQVNEWFPLDRLVVIALDKSGQSVRSVPFAIEVGDHTPPLLDLRSDMIADARVLPIRAGKFRFRARMICPGTSAQVFINATVRERPQ